MQTLTEKSSFTKFNRNINNWKLLDMHPTKREKSVEEMKLSHDLKLLKVLVDVKNDAKYHAFFFYQNCFKNPPKNQGCF